MMKLTAPAQHPSRRTNFALLRTFAAILDIFGSRL